MAISSENQDVPAVAIVTDEPKGIDQSPHNINKCGSISGPSPASPKSSIIKAEALVTRFLNFLSEASSELLGGIILGLAVCTYLILGRLGLVLIGALGGVVLQAVWEGQSGLARRTEDARREDSLDIVKKVLDWRVEQAKNRDNDETDQHEPPTMSSVGFGDFEPETGVALTGFVDAVIRDYVKWWYKPIVPTDESFPITCRHVLVTFLRSASTNLARKRPADTFLDFLTNSSSIIIVFLGELSSALSVSHDIAMSPGEAVEDYLLTNPESNLASIVDEKQQKKKFKIVAGDILENFLEKSALECSPMRIFLREILASVIMETSLSTFSKGEWINGWIVYLLEEGEPELSQVLDIGLGNTSGAESSLANINSASPIPAEAKKHRKRLSKAEEAMEEAVEEAKRLSQLIAEEDRRRLQGQGGYENGANSAKLASATPSTNIVEAVSCPTNLDTLEKKDNLQVAASIYPSPLSTKLSIDNRAHTFTSFDQIFPPLQPTALQPGPSLNQASLSSNLHNANIILIDDSTANDKGRIRAKPLGDYLIQIEPKSSGGWIVIRKYYDFETLHEVLRRIATISGVTAFTEQHSSLPDWKMHTKSSLRGELERYIRDACWHKQLAESEGMKRFLEKDQAHMQASGNKGIGWPSPAAFESMGKGMLDVLTSAPKGAAESGKAVLGGVTGVLGSLGQRKRESISTDGTHTFGKASASSLPKLDSSHSINEPRVLGNNEETLRNSSPSALTQAHWTPQVERRLSFASNYENGADPELESTEKARISLSSRTSLNSPVGTSNTRNSSRAPSIAARVSSPTEIFDIANITLPPPPSDIADDYGSTTESSSFGHSRTESFVATTRTSTSTAPSFQSLTQAQTEASARPALPKKPRNEITPLTEPETRVAVDLLFAMINELYTLSSVWNIRRTLLIAAKSFMLRPGNPSLASIQNLLQDSIIAPNTTDAGVAAHIYRLRENALPTEEELKGWPPEMTPGEKEKLRLKARQLLVEKGMPVALTGVMGQVATGDALGKIFDCLQVEEIARGLMFGLLLQGIRAMTN